MDYKEFHSMFTRVKHCMTYGDDICEKIAIRQKLIDFCIIPEKERSESQQKYITHLVAESNLDQQTLLHAVAEDLYKLTKHILKYVKELETAEYSTEDKGFIDSVIAESRRFSEEVFDDVPVLQRMY